MSSPPDAEALQTRAKPHPAFRHVRSESAGSLDVVVEEYVHAQTGAKHFHIAAANPENAFLVAFRTVPMDSTGVAHILEHTVLCGSERFPVRDPFFLMLRRSLNTFMNAFTSSDWTAYPFASKNRKDFANLLEVYLDAAFFARLHPLDFAQEGHRLEFARAEDPSSELVYKGVVYNEMKGAMSAPTTVLWQTLSKYLFPTTTYHYNSGGDPADIPDLSYQELREFYNTHYHPSNAVFMTYGDIPAGEHQENFQRLALSRFERLDHHVQVADEKRYVAPIAVEEYYAAEAGEGETDKTHIVLGWMLGRSFELDELLRAHLLTSVLLEDSASPLRQALETTQLGHAPSPLCGLEDSNREMVFACGLEGSRPERTEQVEQLVFEVLERVARDGVPAERVEAMLHQLELHQREIGGDGFPYGLQLMLNGLPAAVHRGDPIAVLNLDPALERLRAAAKDSDFIPRLIRELLLDNTHRVTLTLKPDSRLAARAQQAERRRLAARKAAMTAEEKAQVTAQLKALSERQAQLDDPTVLPKVGIEDIPPEPAIPEGEVERVGKLNATFYAQGTNGLAYQQIVTPLPVLDEDLLAALACYTTCLTETGCGGRSYLETQEWQTSVSGGLEAFSTVRGRIDDVQQVSAYLTLGGKALNRNHARLSELLRESIEKPRFDEYGRLREIIAQERARWEQSVTAKGHALAMAAASSGMSPAAALSHRTTGLEGIRTIKRMDSELKDNACMDEFTQRLTRIHHLLMESPRQFLLIGEPERREAVCADVLEQWRDRQDVTGGQPPFTLPPVNERVHQAWTTATQVSFCAKAYPTVPMDHPDAPVLTVLAGVLRNNFLHSAIRERGGAYGGGASHDADIAAFRFYSYRDPRLGETLTDFDRAVEWLFGGALEARQLEEAILGVIAAIDKPGSPAGEAAKAFHNALYGRDRAQIKRFRQRVITTTVNDLRRVAELYLRPERASIAVITSAAALAAEPELELEQIAI